MTVTIYTGYWERRLSLAPSSEDTEAFVALGPLALTIEDRTVLITPDHGGKSWGHLDPRRHAGLRITYEFFIGERPWARWMRSAHRVELHECGSMMWDIPPDHLLEWPRMRKCDGPIDPYEVAAREFRLRVVSAYEAGGIECVKDTLRRVPERVRSRFLPGHTWRDTINSVIGAI